MSLDIWTIALILPIIYMAGGLGTALTATVVLLGALNVGTDVFLAHKCCEIGKISGNPDLKHACNILPNILKIKKEMVTVGKEMDDAYFSSKYCPLLRA